MNRTHGPDISLVVRDHLCLSCGACFAVCPQSCISFHETVGGYLFPRINEGFCAHCGLCFQVCPGHHFGVGLKERMPPDAFSGEVLSCQVGRAADNDIFKNSQSGGVATAMVKYLFETGQIDGAILTVMENTRPPRGGFLFAHSPSDLPRSQKSKYTPIPILAALRALGKKDSRLAIVGLPCHFHGLHNLLDINPALNRERIFKIGLICDRIMTAAAVDFLAGKATQEPVTGFIFRDKTRPSYPGNTVVEKVDGAQVVLDASLRMTMKDFFTPARCRLCFDKMNVFADVVLGDPHEMPGMDKKHGKTLVLARTPKGQKLVKEIQEHGAAVLQEADTAAALAGQKVDGKRRDWAANMRAWSEMGRLVPEYPFGVPTVPIKKRHRKWINHALRLDNFHTKRKVLRAANLWLARQNAKQFLKKPLKMFLSLLK